MLIDLFLVQLSMLWPRGGTGLPYHMKICWMFLIFGLVSCGGNKRERSNLAVRILRNGDQLFTQRADIEELDRAIQWYLSGVREFPDDAKMMGRLARAYTLRSYGHPPDGLDGYATAKEFGIRCLMTETAFAGLVQSAGGEVTRRSILTLEADRIGCMTWTSIAWGRWLDQRGVVGASIDLVAVQAMAQRAVDVMPQYGGGRPYEALGLALSIPPEPLKPDLVGARKAFLNASKLSPDRLTVAVDLAQYVSAPEGNEAEWRALLTSVVGTEVAEDASDRLENLAAIQRAQALLEAGPNSRWDE